MYNNTANSSFVGGAVTELHFTGNQVVLHGVKDFDQGKMDVSVDGRSRNRGQLLIHPQRVGSPMDIPGTRSGAARAGRRQRRPEEPI